jgi:hypothetical protein
MKISEHEKPMASLDFETLFYLVDPEKGLIPGPSPQETEGFREGRNPNSQIIENNFFRLNGFFYLSK